MIAFADGRMVLYPGLMARIEINAPKRRNALSRSMWLAVPLICDAIEADEAIRAVLLTASADAGGTFCAGADISEFAEVYASVASTTDYNALVRTAQARLRELARPVVAVIAGPCIGGGCGLALAADLRFAGPAARFGIPAARLGLAYSAEDTAQLVEKIGPARAKDLLFSARMIGADEALAIGLIERIIPAPALLAEATAYADDMAMHSGQSIRAAKAAINRLTAPDSAVGAALAEAFAASFASADFAEGRAAFLERRQPKFD